MAIFKLNDLGGREELLSLVLRSTAPGEEFDRVKTIEARAGRVELELTFNRSYEAHCDMTVEEALRVAEQLVAAAEHAEVQRQEIESTRALDASLNAMNRLPKARKARPV